MSNLSELLPAGGAGKNVSFVASGTLPNGQAVVLKADGTVEAVVQTSVAESIPAGSGAEFDSGSNHDGIMMAYDPTTAGRFAVVYSDADNGSYGTIAIGQVSGTSITFGTAIVFVSAWSHAPRLSWSPHTSGQLAIATGRSSKGRIVIGNVSGTSVTFGSESIFFDTGIPDYYDMAFDPITANRLVCVYRDPNNSGYGMAIVGTVSGTSVSFGTAVIFRSTNVQNITLSFDPNTANQFVVSYGMQANSGYGQAIIGTLSSTSVSFGSSVTYTANGAAAFHYVSYDQKIAGKFYAAFQDSMNSDYGTAVCCTVSGTTISTGQIVIFNSGATQYVSIAGDPNTANQFLVSYRDNGNSGYGTAVRGTVSGTVISYASASVLSSSLTTSNVSFDPNNAGQFALCTNVPTGRAILGQLAVTATNLTATNFIGMADAAIADTAAGSVTIKGGLAKSVSNVAASMPFGAETLFNVGTSIYTNVAYDPNNANKFVAVYRDHANSSYGTAIVGTISGTSITFGSEVVFNTGDTQHPMISFDPNTTGKFVVTYQDAGNTNRGTAIVGTISGTSIAFGSETVFETGQAYYPSSSFDPSTAGTFVVAYRAVGNSNYGTAVVGIVSGNSISFGSKQVFNSGVTNYIKAAFDPSTAGRFVVVYRDATNSNQGKAALLTVSGSTISFIDTETFHAASTLPEHIGFDPNTAGKFVVLYGDTSGSTSGTAIVGTVSGSGAGSSLSFGTAVVFNAANTGSAYISFDPNTSGKFLITSCGGAGTLGYGTAQVGTLSGTSVSFSTSTVFNAGSTQYPSIAYDPNTADKFVIVYRDKGYQSYGTAIVGSLSNVLAAGTDYYVQGDGTISTTSTSPAVKLGKALSTTSINLEFNT
tara:strand:- start:2547 stop:5165 length:2619 start_codon:yes stop_codon:yes gene_type:complete